MLNRLVIYLYDLLATAKGYRFVKVQTKEQYEDVDKIYAMEGFSFPEHLQEDLKKYKEGTLNFIAYYKRIPIGTVRMANPKVVNRTYGSLRS